MFQFDSKQEDEVMIQLDAKQEDEVVGLDDNEVEDILELVSNDQQRFYIPKKVAKLSGLLQTMMDTGKLT
jgi:hypothetical protein